MIAALVPGAGGTYAPASALHRPDPEADASGRGSFASLIDQKTSAADHVPAGGARRLPTTGAPGSTPQPSRPQAGRLSRRRQDDDRDAQSGSAGAEVEHDRVDVSVDTPQGTGAAVPPRKTGAGDHQTADGRPGAPVPTTLSPADLGTTFPAATVAGQESSHTDVLPGDASSDGGASPATQAPAPSLSDKAIEHISSTAIAMGSATKSHAGGQTSVIPLDPPSDGQTAATGSPGRPEIAQLRDVLASALAQSDEAPSGKRDAVSITPPSFFGGQAASAGRISDGAGQPQLDVDVKGEGNGGTSPGSAALFARAMMRAADSEAGGGQPPASVGAHASGAASVLSLTSVQAPNVEPMAISAPVQALAAESPAAADDGALRTQVVQVIRLQWQAGVGQATIQLQPEHLGPLTVALRVEGGSVSADMRVETSAAQQWIASHEADLRSALERQGLTLAKMTVNEEPQPRQQPRQPAAQDDPTPQRRRQAETREFTLEA